MGNEESMYKDMTLFNSVANVGVRAWNRLNTINNLKSSGRVKDAAGYLNKLKEVDRISVGLILMSIKKKGLEVTRREIHKGDYNEDISNS